MMNTDLYLPISSSVTSDYGNQQSNVKPQGEVIEVVQPVVKVETNKQIQEQQQSEKPISNEDLELVVTDMNSVAQNLQRNILFSVDEKSGGTFVTVIDKETEEVVREIPSKEVREIKARLEEVAGLIFKESV
jgi:flagellar protein FlaG